MGSAAFYDYACEPHIVYRFGQLCCLALVALVSGGSPLQSPGRISSVRRACGCGEVATGRPRSSRAGTASQMTRKLLVIIALGGSPGDYCCGNASSLTVGTDDLTVTVPDGTGGGNVLPQCAEPLRQRRRRPHRPRATRAAAARPIPPSTTLPPAVGRHRHDQRGSGRPAPAAPTTALHHAAPTHDHRRQRAAMRRQGRQGRHQGQDAQGPLRQAEQEGQGRQGDRQGRAPEDPEPTLRNPDGSPAPPTPA